METLKLILLALVEALPIIGGLIKSFKKTEQEKADKAVEEVRKEIDEFRRTGRPPQ